MYILLAFHFNILYIYSYHAWVSYVGFSEAYNETVRLCDAWNTGPVGKWRLQWEDKSDNQEG